MVPLSYAIGGVDGNVRLLDTSNRNQEPEQQRCAVYDLSTIHVRITSIPPERFI
jgi:hypothetical protein